MGPAEGAAMLGEIWKIGDWSVFPAENTLRRDGSEVKVPPRLMDALIFFARHPDHVISRTELVAHLWNRSVVTDQTVTRTFSNFARRCVMDEAGKRRRNTLRQCRSAVISSSLMQSFCALRRPRSRSRMPFLLKVLLKLN